MAGNGTSGYVDGNGAGAEFVGPTGVAADSRGNIYISDYTGHRIRKITADGVVSTLAGSGISGFADGNGVAAQFSYPSGITFGTDGNIYVADNGNQRIRMITPSGDVSTLAGTGVAGFADGTGPAAQFSSPFAITADSQGNLFVADLVNNRIRKITIE
jgi:streptogramin lyase